MDTRRKKCNDSKTSLMLLLIHVVINADIERILRVHHATLRIVILKRISENLIIFTFNRKDAVHCQFIR